MKTLSPWVALGIVLAGCGGAGVGVSPNAAHTVGPAKGKGAAVMKVMWPARSARLIPNACNSLVVTATYNGQLVSQSTIARPSGASTTETSLTDLPIGTVDVAISGYPTTDGSGVAVANGLSQMTVTAGATASVTVSLMSTASRLVVTGSSSGLVSGGTETLTASAYDSANNVVLLSAGGGTDPVEWVSSRTGVATVQGTGPSATLTAVADGWTQVTATLQTNSYGGTISGTFATAIGVPMLATGGFPMSYGNPGNTGVGGGQGAAGTVAWTKSIGTSPIGALIVGPDDTVYAASGGTVAAISGGQILWSQTVSGTVTGLLLTQNGQLYVTASGFTSLLAQTGATVWAMATDSNCFAPNIGSDGTIYLASQKSVYAVNGLTHAINWQVSFGSSRGPVVCQDGTIAAINTSTLLELNPASGGTIGSYKPATGYRLQDICSTNDLVYFDSYKPVSQNAFVTFDDYALFSAPTSGAAATELCSFTMGRSGKASGLAISPNGVTAIPQSGVIPIGTSDLWLVSPTGTVSSVANEGSLDGISFGSDGTAYIDGALSTPLVSLSALDSTTFVAKWSVPLTPGNCPPAIGPSGTVYAGSSTGSVTAVK